MVMPTRQVKARLMGNEHEVGKLAQALRSPRGYVINMDVPDLALFPWLKGLHVNPQPFLVRDSPDCHIKHIYVFAIYS